MRGCTLKNLFIDSSNKNLSLAILSFDELIYVSNVNSYYRHSNFLMNEIIAALNKTGLKINDIDNIVVLNGPGSFTGIRVGVTIAKTLAWVLNKNIYSLSTLRALSLQVSDSNVISAIMDKPDSGYVGIYFDDLKMENYYTILDLKEKINGKKLTLVCSDKNEFINNLYEALSESNEVSIKIINNYDYLKVVKNAISYKPLNPHMVSPIYLKKIDAEKKRISD